PSAPPQEVHLSSLSSTSLKVSWVAPPAASRHGAIVAYTVSYQATGSTNEDPERHEVSGIGADASSYVLEGLEKWTEYQVWVSAHTDVGPGPESTPVRIKTKEDGIKITNLRKSLRMTIVVCMGRGILKPCISDSGVIHFKVPPLTSHLTFPQCTSSGGELYKNSPPPPFTVPGAAPRKLEVVAVNSTAIRVTWKPPLPGKQHGQIRGYQVIFSRLENREPRGFCSISSCPKDSDSFGCRASMASITWFRAVLNSVRLISSFTIILISTA
ncbi:unnamed protein product, partial [Coregonus sp. 'balchen']